VRWPWRRGGVPSEDAEHAKAQAKRALKDAENFDKRADAAAKRFERTKERNHIAESIEAVIRPVPRRAE